MNHVLFLKQLIPKRVSTQITGTTKSNICLTHKHSFSIVSLKMLIRDHANGCTPSISWGENIHNND